MGGVPKEGLQGGLGGRAGWEVGRPGRPRLLSVYSEPKALDPKYSDLVGTGGRDGTMIPSAEFW